ncbi:hypothetical protein [Stackebrandtia nassauensis]|uniref:Uncharacterized protein n=1 Tax=Stackebrandtia nassauensis (strain DSM 44728 / CIP 108903 / NRRL B-16338 / NBRC 102104 / LLR-40K-21) TaxID=446470 RepID=D3Q6R0_STANL|nr:hypothetical protein [Stackebrandtia nassauensis]ADD44303.1 hypothetical protein Snas_4660 [Stackebrandtia nassauensis DSM 44728]
MSETAIAEPATRAKATGLARTTRINAILIAVVTLAQPVWIGLLFTGSVFGAVAHGIGAGALVLLSLIHLVLSIVRSRGRGKSEVWGNLAFIGLIVAQSLLGVFQLYPLHFPVGVLMAIGSVHLVQATNKEVRDAGTEAKA